jgi:tRNA(Ile)-lysidine synthase
VHIENVRGLPEVLRKSCIIDFLYNNLGEYPSRGLADDVLGFLLAGRNGQLSLSADRILTISYGSARVTDRAGDAEKEISSVSRELRIPGTVFFPSKGMVIKADLRSVNEPGRYPEGQNALISRNCFTGSLWVRKRLPGDLFVPLGMGSKKKLKNFLIDRKIPREQRDRIPLVLNSEGEILWVGGIEISQTAALTGMKGEDAVELSLKCPAARGDISV